MSPFNLIFCSVDDSSGVSGGERYDELLCQKGDTIPGFSAHRMVVFPTPDGEPPRKMSLELNVLQKITAPLKAIKNIFKLRREVIKTGATPIWHFNTSKCLYFLPALFLLRLSGDKCIGITHHMMYLQFKGFGSKVYKLLEGFFIRNLSVRVTPSEYTREIMLQATRKNDIRILPIPFDKTAVPGMDVEEGLANCVREKGLLLYVGTIESRKGLNYLLDAMTILGKNPAGKFRLKIVGKVVDEEYARRLKLQVMSAGIDVEFCGYVSEMQKKRLYAEAEMFVFPSLAEGYGIVLVDAMRNGLPIVAFDNTAIPYVTGYNEERGILCETANACALADAILRLHNDELLGKKLADSGLEYVSRLPGMSEFANTWREILNGMTLNCNVKG